MLSRSMSASAWYGFLSVTSGVSVVSFTLALRSFIRPLFFNLSLRLAISGLFFMILSRGEGGFGAWFKHLRGEREREKE